MGNDDSTPQLVLSLIEAYPPPLFFILFMSLRTFLNKLYLGSGFLAGVCIVLITLMILSQIVGRWFGLIIPSTEDFSGFFLAAATFLALPYTFRTGGHIRVTILVNLLKGKAQRLALAFALLILIGLIAYGSYYSVLFVLESLAFKEVSQGYIPVPLWIPQSFMALGLVIFLVALIDDFLLVISGKTPVFVELEE